MTRHAVIRAAKVDARTSVALFTHGQHAPGKNHGMEVLPVWPGIPLRLPGFVRENPSIWRFCELAVAGWAGFFQHDQSLAVSFVVMPGKGRAEAQKTVDEQNLRLISLCDVRAVFFRMPKTLSGRAFQPIVQAPF